MGSILVRSAVQRVVRLCREGVSVRRCRRHSSIYTYNVRIRKGPKVFSGEPTIGTVPTRSSRYVEEDAQAVIIVISILTFAYHRQYSPTEADLFKKL